MTVVLLFTLLRQSFTIMELVVLKWESFPCHWRQELNMRNKEPALESFVFVMWKERETCPRFPYSLSLSLSLSLSHTLSIFLSPPFYSVTLFFLSLFSSDLVSHSHRISLFSHIFSFSLQPVIFSQICISNWIVFSVLFSVSFCFDLTFMNIFYNSVCFITSQENFSVEFKQQKFGSDMFFITCG